MSDTATDTTLTGTYTMDPAHTSLSFVARHAMVTKVRGTFTDVSGSGHFDADDPSKSHFEVTVKVDSIDTRNEQRDGHLRTNDFFDLEHYPEITFVSTSVARKDDDEFTVTGDLTVRGVTKPLTFDLELTGPVQDPWGNARIGLEGSVKVNRGDWDLKWNTPLDAGGVLVSEKVTLEFDVAATKDA